MAELWKFIVTATHWFVAIPIWALLGGLIGGITLVIFNHFSYEFEMISHRWELLREDQKKFREECAIREKNLTNGWKNIESEKKKYKNAILEKREAMKRLDNFYNIWANQQFVITELEQKASYELMIADIESRVSENEFMKFLKKNLKYVETSLDKSGVQPTRIVIDNIRNKLFDAIGESSYQNFVIKHYGNLIEFGYNPVLVAWELYSIYGRA